MSSQLVLGGTVVTPVGEQRADIRIEDDRIQAVGLDLPNAHHSINARGLHIFPATIDVHLHFNEPGREEWEGAATGSRALAAGGGSVFFDMPLNSTPCTINPCEFDRKRAALEAASIADFGIWGGLVPGSVFDMPEMAARGVVGFKAFLCNSGLPEFPRTDDLTLYEGLVEAAKLNLPVAVHAEGEELTRELSRKLSHLKLSAIESFLQSRPILAELEAISRATLIAGEAHAKLHIVHISCGRAVVLAAEARARGVDVSIETCPHYLFFTEEDLARLGAVAKCAPPLRGARDRAELLREVAKGTVDIVASDHSPAPPEMKTGEFGNAWGGIAGVQSTLSVLIELGLSVETIVSLLSRNPARRFQIGNRGEIRVGNYADLTLVDSSASFTLTEDAMAHRHRITPYAGKTFRSKVKRTMRRGETIYLDGAFPASGRGQLVRPTN